MLLVPNEDIVTFKGRTTEGIVTGLNFGFGVLVNIFTSLVDLSYNLVGKKKNKPKTMH